MLFPFSFSSSSSLFALFNFSSMEMLTSNSTYFSTSEPKAKLMTRYSREMTLINSDSSDLTKKKVKIHFTYDFLMSAYFLTRKAFVCGTQSRHQMIECEHKVLAIF